MIRNYLYLAAFVYLVCSAAGWQVLQVVLFALISIIALAALQQLRASATLTAHTPRAATPDDKPPVQI